MDRVRIKLIFWFLAVNAFWVILLAVLLEILIGWMIFLKYANPLPIRPVESASSGFDRSSYQKILDYLPKGLK